MMMRTDRTAAGETGSFRARSSRPVAQRLPGIALVLCAAIACDDAITNEGVGILALRVVAADNVMLSNVDEGRIRIIGPTSRTLTVSPGTTQTIEGLAPGSYTVALEGLSGGELETFGVRTGVNVAAGSNTTVTVTMNSFVPVIGSAPADVTAGQSVTVTFSGVTGAVAYMVEYSQSPTFGGAQQTEVTGTTADVTLTAEGAYYIRVRARNDYGSVSLPSASIAVTAGPEIEPLNDYIAFTSNQTGKEQVFVVPSSGGTEIQLTTFADGAGAPDISPDGRRIAYQHEGQQIAVMNADGSDPVVLGTGCYPDWSPDGAEIVFSEFCVTGPINIMNADGTNRRAVSGTGTGFQDLSPRWSPDGTRIVFESDRTGNWDIFVVDRDGQNLQQLTDDPAEDRKPAFSPDGTKISWERRPTGGGQNDLWTMNADGSWPFQVTNDAEADGAPDWAPGREWLAVLRDGEVYRFRPDGSGVVRLTDTGFSSSNSLPRWGPCLDSSCAPTTGQIEATVATYGAGIDPNGFTVTVDGGAGRTANGGSVVTFVGIAPGSHTVAISGLAANCALRGAASVSITAVAGRLVQAPTFEIDCVQVVANEIVVTPSVVNLGFTGATMTIYGTSFDGSGNPVPGFVQLFFQSTNNSVVTVDANGRITANGPGNATINITDGFGRNGSIPVNVSGMFGQTTNSGGHTYAITANAMPWLDAQVLARSTGGYLAAVNNLQENGFLTNVFLGPLNTNLWIGLYDINEEDVWEWTDGSPTSPGASTAGNGGFASWAGDEPNNAGEEDCAHFNAGTAGTWNDLTCDSDVRAIAEWPALGPTIITNPAYYNGHRYAITQHELNWIEARNLAQSLGGRLIVVDDAAENQFLTDTFTQPLNGAPFWLGANDFGTEGTFVWIDGTPFVYENWSTGEPNNAGDEDCASTIGIQNGQAEWNDVPCYFPRRAIIEWNSLR
jgi:hypothetical protein